MRAFWCLVGCVSVMLSVSVVADGRLIGQTVTVGATPCDRACLTTLLDQYLKAIITHDPVLLR
jgi:hypothetical protein